MATTNPAGVEIVRDGRQDYDTIGAGYALRRRPDPRIGRLIRDALDGAQRVLNVGAGTGSYEPPDLRVVAVEPSEVMISQRPAGSAPVVRAVAEALPFGDGAFDAAMAVLSMHHWQDIPLGLREMQRVGCHRVVLFTYDPAELDHFWLVDYVPEVAAWDRKRLFTSRDLARLLGGADHRVVPIPRDCTDGFLGAFWARPEAYLDPAVHGGMSTLALIEPSILKKRLDRLADDLRSGAWDARYSALRQTEALDVGYRLILAGAGE